jgi:hypothetical protein
MRRLVNVPQCVIGMEPCAGAHHIAPPGGAWSRCAACPRAVREAVPKGS